MTFHRRELLETFEAPLNIVNRSGSIASHSPAPCCHKGFVEQLLSIEMLGYSNPFFCLGSLRLKDLAHAQHCNLECVDIRIEVEE